MAKVKTRDKIKIAAQLLFAERGIDSVGVREIVTAAGQKNMASLHYYFRTKEDLVREVLRDASDAIETRRAELLDQMEKEGGPESPQQVLRIFIESAVISDTDPRSLSNVRLFMLAFQNDAQFVLDTVDDYRESAYVRCLEHLRGFMGTMTSALQEQRLYLLQQFVFNALATRERALSLEGLDTPIWKNKHMLNELIISAEGLLFAKSETSN